MPALRLKLPAPFYGTVASFIGILLLMDLWRLIFLLSQWPVLVSAHWIEYLQAFWVGFPLDAVIAGYLVLPVFFTSYWPKIGWESSLYRHFYSGYMVLVFAVLCFVELGDIAFFNEFGTHVNLLAVQHNATQQDTLLYIWRNYPVIGYLSAIGLTTFLFTFLLKKTLNKIPQHTSTWKSITGSIVISVVLLFTALRGGWQERPVDWGKAMFSTNEMANQIALNPLFFLGRSILELASEKNLGSLMSFYDLPEAVDVTRHLLSGPQVRFTDDSTLTRVVLSDRKPIKPNIMLVVMESQVGEFCGFINPEMKRVTPNLDTLAVHGISFTHCIANGKRSAYGISSLQCSWPVLPGFPLISQIESAGKIMTAGSLFKNLGYETCFLYGGDADFDNMKGFLIANGTDRIIERDAFPAFTPGTTWGVFDHFVFKKALALLDNAEAPLFLTLFTTTNHQPFEIPADYETIIPQFPDATYRDGKPLRTMAYVDRVIGEFMDKAGDHAWFDNTIFIFISDHGLSVHRDMFEDPRNANIPFLIYAPGILEAPQEITAVVSQVDVLPMTLSLIGYSKPYEFFGRNALEGGPGFACRVVNDHVLWFEKDLIYEENLGQNNTLYQTETLYQQPYRKVPESDERFATVQKRCRAYLESAFFLFKNRN